MARTITLENGRILRLTQGWQHSYQQTHYRASARQTHGVAETDIPCGIVLHIGAGDDTDCPHCSPHVHQVLHGVWWDNDGWDNGEQRH
jgi:hypothetical protein